MTNPPQYYDIALRGLMLGALTLTRLAWAFARRQAEPVGEPSQLKQAA
jgi:hypothetical protein